MTASRSHEVKDFACVHCGARTGWALLSQPCPRRAITALTGRREYQRAYREAHPESREADRLRARAKREAARGCADTADDERAHESNA